MQKAVDETRKAEQADLSDNQRKQMFRSRYLFLYNKENIPEKRAGDFESIRKIAVKTSRAWANKENLRDQWSKANGNREAASAFFKKWYWWATHSRLRHVVNAAHTLKKHLDGILNAIEHDVTNALTEGLNQKMEALKRSACGFRNKQSFMTAIMFHCGKLNMLP